MERLSNSYLQMIMAIGQAFQAIELKEEETLWLKYAEIPWFPGGQFCISIIESADDDNLKCIKQTWDHQYDLDRFSTGVYNLSRLCIRKSQAIISEVQRSRLTAIINSIDHFPDTLHRGEAIILDGIDYQLAINTKLERKNYEWKEATSDIKYYEPLIHFLLAIE